MARKAAKSSARSKSKSKTKPRRRKRETGLKVASRAKRAVRRTAVRVVGKAGEVIHRAAVEAAEREQKSARKTLKTPSAEPARPRVPRRPAVQAQPRPVVRTSTPIPDADLRTPAQTSSHGPFDRRSERDPDKILPGEKLINEQFAEEDEYTNKTGDPRIGTRGRNYRP